MAYEGHAVTNYTWCPWKIPPRIGKETGRLGYKRTREVHLDNSIIEIGQNSEKRPEDLRRLTVTQTSAEKLLHSLERATAGIGPHVNAHKTEYMCFNQAYDISTQERTSLKLVDEFTYQESSVSSTEKDIDALLTKAWTAIDKISIIWKSDLTDKMKAAVVSILLYGCTTWTDNKMAREEARRQLHKNVASNFE